MTAVAKKKSGEEVERSKRPVFNYFQEISILYGLSSCAPAMQDPA
jgi:hypothetical protein